MKATLVFLWVGLLCAGSLLNVVEASKRNSQSKSHSVNSLTRHSSQTARDKSHFTGLTRAAGDSDDKGPKYSYETEGDRPCEGDYYESIQTVSDPDSLKVENGYTYISKVLNIQADITNKTSAVVSYEQCIDGSYSYEGCRSYGKIEYYDNFCDLLADPTPDMRYPWESLFAASPDLPKGCPIPAGNYTVTDERLYNPKIEDLYEETGKEYWAGYLYFLVSSQHEVLYCRMLPVHVSKKT